VDISDTGSNSGQIGSFPLNLAPRTVKLASSSYYSYPKNLTDEDDPFDLLKRGPSPVRQAPETVEDHVATGLLVNIDTGQSPASNTDLELPPLSSLLSTTGSLSGSLPNPRGMSSLFGHLSSVCSLPPATATVSSILSDDVFLSPSSHMNQSYISDEPNWDQMLLNAKAPQSEPNWDQMMSDAQSAAISVSSAKKKSAKTPGAGQVRLETVLANFSPCDGGDLGSPLALLDTSKEDQIPDYDFLVSLTPEKSPTAKLSKKFSATKNLATSEMLENLNKHASDLSLYEVGQEVGESFLGDFESDSSSKNDGSLCSEKSTSNIYSKDQDTGSKSKNVNDTPRDKKEIDSIKKRLASIKENLEPAQPQTRTVFDVSSRAPKAKLSLLKGIGSNKKNIETSHIKSSRTEMQRSVKDSSSSKSASTSKSSSNQSSLSRLTLGSNKSKVTTEKETISKKSNTIIYDKNTPLRPSSEVKSAPLKAKTTIGNTPLKPKSTIGCTPIKPRSSVRTNSSVSISRSSSVSSSRTSSVSRSDSCRTPLLPNSTPLRSKSVTRGTSQDTTVPGVRRLPETQTPTPGCVSPPVKPMVATPSLSNRAKPTFKTPTATAGSSRKLPASLPSNKTGGIKQPSSNVHRPGFVRQGSNLSSLAPTLPAPPRFSTPRVRSSLSHLPSPQTQTGTNSSLRHSTPVMVKKGVNTARSGTSQ